jgi:GntR family transcriptional repressor for pyruvate dehydrogenase complex
MFRVIKSQRLSDDAVEQIVNLIRAGRLGPGDRLPSERDLRDSLGVSRASVREAVRTLETMGILRVSPGRGTFVREDLVQGGVSLSDGWLSTHYTDVLDLLEMRETLEVKAAALAAERATGDQVAAIQAQLDGIAYAIANSGIEEMTAADAAFHNRIAEAAGNRILVGVLESLEELAVDTRKVVVQLPGRTDRAFDEHKAVADAIANHDAEEAAHAMLLHVRQVQDELMAALARDKLVIDGEPSDGNDDA